MADPAYLDQLARKLADEGKLIEAGWISFRRHTLPEGRDRGPDLEVMRLAFMAGAQHLWGSIFMLLDGDHDPTQADLSRMAAIHAEMERFYDELKLRVAKPGGTA